MYCDFDGTITKKDIGDELFKVYGKFQPYNQELRKGKFSITKYWQIQCRELDPGIDAFTIAQFARECETDPYFKEFTQYCETNNIALSIVSDGFEEYIYPILEKEGLSHLPVYCNRMDFTEDRIRPVFPGADESCECPCASCKRNAVLSNTPPESIIVFIGDGHSDYCAAEHADIVFAKKELAAYCNDNRIPHYPFKTFFDVLRIFKKIVNNNDIRIRHQAKLKRIKAFEIE